MYKKLLKTLVMVGLVALTFGSLPALAEDDSLSISADVGFFSQYVWRGYALSDESIVIQPSVTLAYNGFGLNIWGNFDTDYYDTESDYNETDITLSYDWSYDIFDFGVGYIVYDLDNFDTHEFYFTATAESYLNPSITLYRDIDEAKGWYANISIGHSYTITSELELDLSASIGYYDRDDYHSEHDANISASYTVDITDNLSITPSFKYTWPLSSEARTEVKDFKGHTDHFVGGFTFSYSF